MVCLNTQVTKINHMLMPYFFQNKYELSILLTTLNLGNNCLLLSYINFNTPVSFMNSSLSRPVQVISDQTQNLSHSMQVTSVFDTQPPVSANGSLSQNNPAFVVLVNFLLLQQRIWENQLKEESFIWSIASEATGLMATGPHFLDLWYGKASRWGTLDGTKLSISQQQEAKKFRGKDQDQTHPSNTITYSFYLAPYLPMFQTPSNGQFVYLLVD